MEEKRISKTGKKWGIVATGAAAAVLSLCICGVCLSQNAAAAGKAAAEKTVTASVVAVAADTSSGAVSAISQAEALEIAYAQAGVDAADVLKAKVELDSKKGAAVYDVEFTSTTKKGEYEIDAATGEILDYEVKTESTDKKGLSGVSRIGEAAAREIALSHAGVAVEDVLKIETELDEDNGAWIYEVEFETSTQKGEYEIDAVTGDVLRYKLEDKNTGTAAGGSASDDDASSSSAGSTSYIGGEAAENAALANAGVSRSSTTYLKWYYRYSSGNPVNYCVEFATGSTKYVYFIDLYSGEVVHYNTYPFHHH